MGKGFTLIELMVAIVLMAILVAFALPSYQQYARKNNEKIAEQKLQDISLKLANEKSINFSFNGFHLDALDQTTPKNALGADIKYNITVDTSVFQKWLLKACINTGLKDASSYNNYALNSDGNSCRWKEETLCTVPDKCKVSP